MFVNVSGHKTYCYTGSKAFDPAKPTLLFIHGVLNDHSVWILQSRYFAHHGYNVLAIDLPGHGKSEGDCPTSVEEAASFIGALLDAVGVHQAALIGHSWGSLIALHAASLQPERVSHLALLGTAFPMKVSPALLDASLNEPSKAIDMVNTFSHSSLAPPPSALGPGTWLYGSSKALMRRVLTSNTRENLFHTGFSACNLYAGALEAAKSLNAGVFINKFAILFIVGKHDQMTTPQAAQSMIAALPSAKVTYVDGGHAFMMEAPEQTLQALQVGLQVAV
jgi:pimeloyl-ACP methyl ester carboxylesterase